MAMRRQQRPFLLCQDQVPAVAAVACDVRNLAGRGRGGGGGGGGERRRGQVSRWGSRLHVTLLLGGTFLWLGPKSGCVIFRQRGRMRFGEGLLTRKREKGSGLRSA